MQCVLDPSRLIAPLLALEFAFSAQFPVHARRVSGVSTRAFQRAGNSPARPCEMPAFRPEAVEPLLIDGGGTRIAWRGQP